MRPWWIPLALLALRAPLLTAAETEAASAPGEPSAAVQAFELEARQAALRLLEKDLERRLAELSSLREELAGVLASAEEKSDRELETLISFYQAMKPKKAAVLLEKLPAQLAADVLASMKTREAGKVLNVMKPERAVRISRLLAGQKR
ncbi:MAG: hypothetical protein V3V67_15595 [Myxococcota bacterium]